ncbi:paraquat-inducible protein A [Pararobbsia alpina]|uniref:Intermembrane transport protein PqiA n=1 Tax=Pararobbsia alpina TaxID=621374 RepID=A0A6S7AU48_9BURK|nr:paraquat-inducible protein A [Pararobbsia alpina]CAB3777129.1 Intermembrane transport protein PqiA [Pararobbsia alpina]
MTEPGARNPVPGPIEAGQDSRPAAQARSLRARIHRKPRAPEPAPGPPVEYVTARRLGLLSCHACGLLSRHVPGSHTERCRRCNAVLHARKPDSLARTWALLIAAIIMYLPANLLPVMHTVSLFGDQDDTIMSGIVYFWTSGSWPLAVIVFIASFMVPMLKLVVLGLLAITSQRGSRWRPIQRTRLFRIVEFIGRWSMLDVFVVTLTVALVHFQSLATIYAGPGAIAFGMVVVLTMLASHQFDPRLIWDNIENSGQHHD